MTLTARDIAEKIAASPEGFASAMDRVRHWTREGLLELVGDPNPGTGRKRYYSDKAMPLARVMNAMANAGLEVSKAKTVTSADTLSNILESVWMLYPSIQREKDTNCYISILYGQGHGPKGFGIISTSKDALKNYVDLGDGTEMAIVLNLTQILK